MNNKIQWLNNFIAEVVDGWMLKDLGRLLNDIPHRSGEAGNCNFPITLYVFACIEFLGQLTSDTPIDPKGSYTKDSIMGFINDYFPDDFKQKIQPHKNAFVNIFRNGLAHNYFAKAAGISRTETKPLQVDGQGHLVLDADRFAEAFGMSINNLKTAIKIDAQLAERMVHRYSIQYQGNLQFKVTPTKTYVSGASLTHPSMLQKIATTTTMPLFPSPINKVS